MRPCGCNLRLPKFLFPPRLSLSCDFRIFLKLLNNLTTLFNHKKLGVVRSGQPLIWFMSELLELNAVVSLNSCLSTLVVSLETSLDLLLTNKACSNLNLSRIHLSH